MLTAKQKRRLDGACAAARREDNHRVKLGCRKEHLGELIAQWAALQTYDVDIFPSGDGGCSVECYETIGSVSVDWRFFVS